MRDRADARVRHETRHAGATGANVDAVRLSKNGIGYAQRRTIRQTASAAQNEKPGFSFRLQRPGGVWCQIDPLEHEVGAGNEKRSFVGKPVRTRPKSGRAGDCDRDGSFNVQLTLATVIEQPEGCFAALLDLGNDDARADCVNRTCWD